MLTGSFSSRAVPEGGNWKRLLIVTLSFLMWWPIRGEQDITVLVKTRLCLLCRRPQLCSLPRPLEPTTMCNYRKERRAVDQRTFKIGSVLEVFGACVHVCVMCM